MSGFTFPQDFTPSSGYSYLTVTDKTKLAQVRKILDPFILTKCQCIRIKDTFIKEMELGLMQNPPESSSLQMEITYVPELLNGTEQGEYLALDLGGTNFRVIYSRLEKGRVVEEEVKHYHVNDEKRMGPAEDLFDYLAECIHDFTSEKGLQNHNLPLGFTFSFPMIQHSIKCGFLVTWTKTFKCSGAVGEDAAKMLNDALIKRGDVKVKVAAILNDTTGTLIQGSYMEPNCYIGVILGTGSNACYFEKIENVQKWEGSKAGVKEVLIDIEWGAFGDNGSLDFIKTTVDRELDAVSNHVNSFTYEKYIGGRYLGDVARRIMIKMIEVGALFGGFLPDRLKNPECFPTHFVSQVERDNIEDKTCRTKEIISQIYDKYTEEDVSILKEICYVVTERGTQLIAITLSCLLYKMNRREVHIAVDGSLYKNHPRFHGMITECIQRLLPQQKFNLFLAEDGSGKGAALVAAIAHRLFGEA